MLLVRKSFLAVNVLDGIPRKLAALPGRRTSETKNLKNDKRSNIPGGWKEVFARKKHATPTRKESARIKDGLEKDL